MVKWTIGELAGGASIRWDNEELMVAIRQISLAVVAVAQPRDHLSRLRPLCAFRFFGQRLVRFLCVPDQHGEGDPTAVRRPRKASGAADEVGKLGGLTGVHPAQVKLRRPFTGRNIK